MKLINLLSNAVIFLLLGVFLLLSALFAFEVISSLYVYFKNPLPISLGFLFIVFIFSKTNTFFKNSKKFKVIG